MPTILLIDDMPQMAGVVRQAVPDCEVVHASDGVTGINILRSQRFQFDLILLDNKMGPHPHLDGPTTALKIREINDKIPIRLFTGYDDPLASQLLQELGGGEPILKPIEPSDLSRRIRAAFGSKVIIQPSEATLAFAKNMATERVDIARSVQSKRFCAFSSSRIKQGGLRLLVELSGYSVPLLMMNIADVVEEVEVMGNVLIVTSSDCLSQVIDLSTPILCIAENLRDVLQSVEIIRAASCPIGLVVECAERQQRVSEMIREAIQCLVAGKTFLPTGMKEPFQNHRDLTKQDKEYLRLEILGLTPEEMARELVVAVDSVRSSRRRVRQRLGLVQDDDLYDRIEKWWFNMFFGINGM